MHPPPLLFAGTPACPRFARRVHRGSALAADSAAIPRKAPAKTTYFEAFSTTTYVVSRKSWSIASAASALLSRRVAALTLASCLRALKPEPDPPAPPIGR